MTDTVETINSILQIQGLDLAKDVFDHNSLGNFLIECRDEIERLQDCLKKANANHEHFERSWYLEKDRNEELVTALRACHTSLNVAFDYDGNVFGIKHNDAIDADIMAERVLEKYGD